MVTTQELGDAAAAGLRDCAYDVGPFITLVDGPEFEATWAERRSLLQAQIAGADLVAISKSDLVESHNRERISEALKYDSSNLVELSTLTKLGMDSIINLVATDCS
jgi:G3E family GTPase